MSVQAYLYFNGNCREALEFYGEIFNEQPEILTYGEVPSDQGFSLPAEAGDLVLHAQLNISGSDVMFSDVPPGMDYNQGNNFNLAIISKNEDEIRSIFGKLKEGGKVVMDLQETFWSPCYGNVVDRFGIGWQVSMEGGN